MQSSCEPNQIQVAETTAKILMEHSKYKLTKRGVVRVKGKGHCLFSLEKCIVTILEYKKLLQEM